MALSEFQRAAREHAHRLQKLVDRHAVNPLRSLYQGAAQDLEAKLGQQVARNASPLTLLQHAQMLAQVRQGLGMIGSRMGQALGQASVSAQNAAVNAMVRDVKRLSKQYDGTVGLQLPVEEAHGFLRAVGKRRTSLLRTNAASMKRYGDHVVRKIEHGMAHSLLTGESHSDAIDRMSDTIQKEWWQGERIVRTEAAHAYNATQADAVAESSAAVPGLMMRWVEHVADVTLARLDNRVGDDSVAMHGQLATPNGLFTMPNAMPPGTTGRISPSLVGGQWSNPPNRPNDRAVLQPWRQGWGWAWELVAGVRVVR